MGLARELAHFVTWFYFYNDTNQASTINAKFSFMVFCFPVHSTCYNSVSIYVMLSKMMWLRDVGLRIIDPVSSERDLETPDSPVFHNPLLSPCWIGLLSLSPSCFFGTVLCEGEISLHGLQKNSFPNNFLLKLVGSLSWLIAFFSLEIFFNSNSALFHILFSILLLEQLCSISNHLC